MDCTPAIRSVTGSGPFGVITSDNVDMSEISWVVSDLWKPQWSLEAENGPPSDVSLQLVITADGRQVNTGQQHEGCAGTCDNRQRVVP